MDLRKTDAVAFRRRWAKVNAFTRRETKTLSPERRLRQLDQLYLLPRSGAAPADGSREGEDRRVRRRWNRLRRALSATFPETILGQFAEVLESPELVTRVEPVLRPARRRPRR